MIPIWPRDVADPFTTKSKLTHSTSTSRTLWKITVSMYMVNLYITVTFGKWLGDPYIQGATYIQVPYCVLTDIEKLCKNITLSHFANNDN